MPPNAVVSAPYADTPIILNLASVTGMRYRNLHCLECGREFMERNNDTMYRIGDSDLPNEIAIGSESVKARCGNCQQWYGIQVSISVTYERDAIPLHLQPQSIYISSEPTKKMRYLACLECGHMYHSISDRISQVVDNRVPFEYLNPLRLGPVEVLCRESDCKQVWSLML